MTEKQKRTSGLVLDKLMKMHLIAEQELKQEVIKWLRDSIQDDGLDTIQGYNLVPVETRLQITLHAETLTIHQLMDIIQQVIKAHKEIKLWQNKD